MLQPLEKMWDELAGTAYAKLPENQARAVLEQLFSNTKKIADHVADKAPGLADQFHNFLSRGAGVSRRHRSTLGYWHASRRIAELLDEGAPAAIDAVTEALKDKFAGRPDMLVNLGEGLFRHREFKWITKRLLQGREIAQFNATIDKAVLRARRAAQSADDVLGALKEILTETKYNFPSKDQLGDGIEAGLTKQLVDLAREQLPDGLKEAAAALKPVFDGALP